MSTKNIIRQARTMGAIFLGLDASPCGTDASAIMVADFTGCTETQLLGCDNVPAANNVLAAHSQTLGSTFKLGTAGFWSVGVIMQQPAGVNSISARIGIDNVAAELNTDPATLSPTTRLLDIGLWTNVAGGAVCSRKLQSLPFIVTRNMAKSATLGLVRLLLSNNAGASMAAAAATLAQCSIQFRYHGPIPADLAA